MLLKSFLLHLLLLFSGFCYGTQHICPPLKPLRLVLVYIQ